MSEESSPRPFPEARPPHLPDALTRQSPWLVFTAALILQIWRAFQSFDPVVHATDLGSAVSYGLSWVSSIVPPILGLALFWRHPDARRTTPLLVFGLLLLSLGELLDAFSEPIGTFLRTIAPPNDADLVTGIQSPAEFAFRVFTSLLAVFALLYIGAGLSLARTRERRSAERPLAVWLAALAIVSTVLSITVLPGLLVDVTPMFVAQVVIGAIISGLVTFGWAYIATVTLGGWMAGEPPRRAWAVAAFGTSVLLAVRLLFPVLNLVLFDPQAVPVFWILASASYVGWFMLAAAFLLGLPMPPTPAMEDEPTVDPPAATQPDSAAS